MRGMARAFEAKTAELRGVSAWRQIAEAAERDHTLRQVGMGVAHPGDGAPTLWGRTDFTMSDLAVDSQWVYARLSFLIKETTAALSGSTGSSVLDDIGRVMSMLGARLRWDAALDLILADRLIAESRYAVGPLSYLPEALRPALVDGVPELRARVLYAIDALTLIHHAALDGDRVTRLSAEPVTMPQLDDALTWFRCYAEAHRDLRQPRRQARPLRSRRTRRPRAG